MKETNLFEVETLEDWQLEADVVVIGGGGASNSNSSNNSADEP